MEVKQAAQISDLAKKHREEIESELSYQEAYFQEQIMDLRRETACYRSWNEAIMAKYDKIIREKDGNTRKRVETLEKRLQTANSGPENAAETDPATKTAGKTAKSEKKFVKPIKAHPKIINKENQDPNRTLNAKKPGILKNPGDESRILRPRAQNTKFQAPKQLEKSAKFVFFSTQNNMLKKQIQN